MGRVDIETVLKTLPVVKNEFKTSHIYLLTMKKAKKMGNNKINLNVFLKSEKLFMTFIATMKIYLSQAKIVTVERKKITRLNQKMSHQLRRSNHVITWQHNN